MSSRSSRSDAADGERLASLLIAVAAAPRGLTVREILTSVIGYEAELPGPLLEDFDPELPSIVAARRAFERDKQALRALGITFEITHFRGEDRYRLGRRSFTRPISLTPAQASALAVAASAWREGELPVSARNALTKLRGLAAGMDEAALPVGTATGGPRRKPTLEVDLAGAEVQPAIVDALTEHRRLRLRYASLSSAGEAPASREVEPWRLERRDGGWYLRAFDLSHGEPRTFRLSRIVGEAEFASDPGAFTAPPEEAPTVREAILALAPARAWALRQSGNPISDGDPRLSGVWPPSAGGSSGSTAGRGREAWEGWELLSLPFTDALSLAGMLAGYGDAVLVLAPGDLREAVLAHLRGATAVASEPRAASEELASAAQPAQRPEGDRDAAPAQ